MFRDAHDLLSTPPMLCGLLREGCERRASVQSLTLQFRTCRVPAENSPKGIHNLAQGQRATASATLGTRATHLVFSPKGIHTQRFAPTSRTRGTAFDAGLRGRGP